MEGVRVQTSYANSTADNGRQNHLLARLPAEDYAKLAPNLVTRIFESGKVLQEAGDPILRVYFLHSGTVSLLGVLPDGSSFCTAIIGREGGLGLPAGLGSRFAFSQAVVQSPVTAACLSAAQFALVAPHSAALRTMIMRYNDLLLAQTQQTLVCNSAHYLQARLCRWLLHARDGIGSDTLVLTQQFLSRMLGVQRTSVNLILGMLQSEGLIDVQRGRIHLRDLAALEKKSCCCYAIVRQLTISAGQDYADLFPNAAFAR
jgi:CRP-like cAMP-binding protein